MPAVSVENVLVLPRIVGPSTGALRPVRRVATSRQLIILGSTRSGRNGEAVVNWVFAHASQRDDAEFELVDTRLLAEPIPANSN